LGIGVIGVGVRGRHSWEHVLARHPACVVRAVSLYPGISSALLEGRDEAQAREYARSWRAEYHDDFRDLLARDDVHCVSLMVEPARTPDIAEAVCAAGKHFVCDKPLAADVPGGERIVAAVAAAGVQTLVTYSVRYSSALRRAREAVAAGEIGDLMVANFTYLMAGGPLAGFRATAEYRERVGGGELSNFGCYALDYLQWLTGSQVQNVFAQTGAFFYEDYRAAGLEDLAQMSLRFDNGVLGAVITGRTTTPANGRITVLDLTGTRGALRCDDLTDVLELRGDGYRRVGYGSDPAQEMIFEFVDNLLAGRPSPITVEDGLANLRVIAAAYRSAASGAVASLSAGG